MCQFFWVAEEVDMKDQYIGDELPKTGRQLGQFLDLIGEFTKKRG